MNIYKQSEIDEITNILKQGGVICVPTDTVYGLCGCINSEKVKQKLIEIKMRPSNKLFPIMCADIDQIKEIAVIDGKADKIIQNFMPGPITLVLRKRANLPNYINNGKDTIAIRMATSKFLEELIKKVDCPVFMSSANKSGYPTCTNIEEIKLACPNLNGIVEGSVKFGMPSTIVSCIENKIKIIRDGPITLEQINNVVNN